MSIQHSSFQADTSPSQAGTDLSVLDYLAKNVMNGLQKSNQGLELPLSSFSDRLVDIGYRRFRLRLIVR